MSLRIVFMGTPDFAVPCLSTLIESGHEIAGVFTQPDKPKGRGYKLTPPPVKELALQHHIPVYQPEKMRDGTALAIMRELAPQLVVVVAYGRILPKELLEIPPLGCVNVHGSLLPQYRGAAPIQWAVLNGDAVSGVTTMYMDEGLDTGDMILKMETAVGENETSGELFDRLSELGAKALIETVKLIEADNAPRVPQDHSAATHTTMIQKEMARIDFTKPSDEIHNLIRGMHPWPVAYTALGGELLKIHKAVPADGSGKPGEVIDPVQLIVACGEGAIRVLELQAQGGRRLPAADYLRGHPIKTGTILGN